MKKVLPNPARVYQIKARIIGNEKIKDGYFRLAVAAPGIAECACPGQFIHIRIGRDYSPLLRRPFSLHKVSRRHIEIVYQVVGKGTTILCKYNPGDYLDIIGPLGNGFDLPPVTGRRTPVLIAGGIGVAPLVFLAEKLAYKKNRRPKLPARAYRPGPIVLLGAKAKNNLLCLREFRGMGYKVSIATDDGSRGLKGKATDLLPNTLSTIHYPLSTIIYACGPKPMLEEVIRISQAHNIPAQLCFEEMIGCGIGACMGCVVKTRQGYRRICKDGPVFWAKDLS